MVVDFNHVLERIESDDPDLIMPPPETDKPFSISELRTFRTWIKNGAKRTAHWAFDAPRRPQIPNADAKSVILNPIDAFVVETLQEQGLTQAEPANRAIWLRRLSLDLTGLPPSVDEVDAFMNDDSSDAFQLQIERLLSSPHFGERWARMWLDNARYADSDGYGKDKPRTMWFYRDWVVNALNSDLPYDQFIIKQIAGDLQQTPDQSSLIATGFLRNSMTPNEGGADPEEYRMKAMFDRMDAIGKGVLGLSLECAQCHTHKTDPLQHEDYYSLFACINNTDDAIIAVYTPQEQERRKQVLADIEELKNQLMAIVESDDSLVQQWAQHLVESKQRWAVLVPETLPFEGTKYRKLEDHSILSEGYAPKLSKTGFHLKTNATNIRSIRLELLTDPQLPRNGPGRSLRGTAAISEFKVFIAPLDDPDAMKEVKIESALADVNPPLQPQPNYLPHSGNRRLSDPRSVGPIEFAIDGNESTAWTTDNDPLRRNTSRVAVFQLKDPVGFSEGSLLEFQPIQLHGGWNNHDNHSCLIGRFRFSISSEDQQTASPALIEQILAIPASDRTPDQRLACWRHWRKTAGVTNDRVEEIEKRIDVLCSQYPEGTNQFVLADRTTDRRTTSVLARGDFLSPTRQVQPGVPDFLHPMIESSDDKNSMPPRLALANWLVSRQSPTTARSIVNRIWQEYFGTGLQETTGDFGVQSPPPSHQRLLDWLAVELMDNGWRLKHIHRLIVSSATYRQSGKFREEAVQLDPDNRLLSRGPRGPITAEMVRDMSLSVSGLLNEKVGGPPVFPPIPKHLLRPPVTYSPRTWEEDRNPDRYRRALYTFRFRNAGYPMLETFDAPDGFVSCVRRNRSNTPMQSLVLLNGPLMMECAWALGELALEHDCESDEQRLTWMMRQCVSRVPDNAEITMLMQLLKTQRSRIAQKEVKLNEVRRRIFDGRDPKRPVISDGRPVPLGERAAWMLVARVLLSLDETTTKP